MNKILTLILLGSTAASYAGYNRGNCPSCNDGRGYYPEERQGYQRDGRSNNRYNQYDTQGNQSYDRNPGYNDNRGQYSDRNMQNNYRDQYSDRNMQGNYNNRNQNANNGQVSDQDIRKEIQDTVGSGWFTEGYKNVSFDVNNGNVTLRGTVDTINDKNKVEDSVRKIDGVRQINNQINVSERNSNNTYSDSDLQSSETKFPQDRAGNLQDRQINARIRDKLNNGWFSKGYETLMIRTANGIVMISGTVDKPEDIQAINDDIQEIEGVRSVNNQLNVKNR